MSFDRIVITDTFQLYDDKYEKNNNDMFSKDDSEYIKHDGITEYRHIKFKEKFQNKNITKEDIFYYIYAILNSKDYNEKFEADLKSHCLKYKLLMNMKILKSFWRPEEN